MSAATACMPLVPPSPLHGSSAAMAAAVERRQQQPGAMETTKTAGSEGTVVVKSHGDDQDCAGDDDGDVTMSRPRAVIQTLTCERKPFSEGFALWRSIGRPELPELDPILSFDEFEFSAPAGFPDHPHRGFENVTYMLEGGISYHDFSGHKGTINTGDVQWLTAGRGVVHAEMPAGQGVQRGINIWINLSAADKMVEPRYQDLASHDIPTAVTADGVSVKVIAGECLGTRSPLQPRTSALCLDVALRPGACLRQPIPRGWSACTYVIHGEAAFFGGSASDGGGATTVAARTLVVFGNDGDCVEVRGADASAGQQEGTTRVMLVAARLDMEQLKKLCDGMDGKDAAEKARLLSNALRNESSSKEAKKIEANGVERSAPKSNSTGGRVTEGSSSILNSYEKKERPWGKEEIEMLRKAIQKYPKGTSRRWEVVSEFIGTSRSVEEILKATKTVLLQKPDSSKAFDSFLEKRKPTQSIASPLSTRDEISSSTEGAETALSKAAAQPASTQTANGKAVADPVPDGAPSVSDPDAWTEAQVLALLQALKAFPKDASQRWERVAAAVPGKTVVQCKKKVAAMRENFRSKKSGE